MKTITLFLLVSALGAAQDRSTSGTSASVKTAAAPAATGIPKGALEIEPNLYRYTDAHGKAWLARMTPFGVSTWEDKPAPVTPVVKAKEEPPKATDLGDNVRFQKKSPFGESTWVKKKSELTDEEKDWLSRGAAAKDSGGNSAAQSKPAQSAGEAAGKR
jgi:hypothetical protein